MAIDVTAVEWMHRQGHPGYFVSKDGLYQTLTTELGGFIICETKGTPAGFRILAGPADSLQALGLPEDLVEEGEDRMFDDLKLALASGQA